MTGIRSTHNRQGNPNAARKKDTGEPGNGGQFGTTPRADSGISLTPSPAIGPANSPYRAFRTAQRFAILHRADTVDGDIDDTLNQAPPLTLDEAATQSATLRQHGLHGEVLALVDGQWVDRMGHTAAEIREAWRAWHEGENTPAWAAPPPAPQPGASAWAAPPPGPRT